MLVQVHIYFAGRKDVYTWPSKYLLYWKKNYKLGQVSIYFAVSKDVPTEEKQIKLAK